MKQYYEALFLSYKPRTECSNLQFGQPVLTLAAPAVVECLTACSQRRFLAEHSVAKLNNVVAFRNNVAAMLQRCVALKIVVANRLVEHHLYAFIFYLMLLSRCNLQKRLIRTAFWVLLQASLMNDWKQTAQWLESQGRLLTINKNIYIIRWNIYRDNKFHSRRQVLKGLYKSLVLKLKVCVLSPLPGVRFFH